MTLRKYRGQDFDVRSLKHFSENFRTSYQKVIERNAGDTFLICLGDGPRLQKTFHEFNCDVQIVLDKIQNTLEEIDIFVTRAGNTYSHVVHIFAILLADKVLFPINPAESADFVAAQVRQLKRKSFVFDDSNFFDFSGGSGRVKTAHPVSPTGNSRATPLDADFIYVLTSGSTGHSKIVRQRQMGLLSNVEALIDHHRLVQKTTIGTCLPVFHVNALEFSLMCSFFSGGKLVLWKSFDAATVSEQIEAEDVQIYSATPEILRVLALKAATNAHMRENLRGLKYFVSAASALSKQIVGQIWSRLGLRIIQGYGLSEAINFSATLPPNIETSTYEKVMIESQYPSIGVELWGNHLFILGDDDEIQGEGSKGEIAIQGFNVMSSYVGQDSPIDFFRTGDLGFYQVVEGAKYFFISGRKKDMAKRFGETVPLRDIDDFFSDVGIQGFDCIAISFRNAHSGEEIGLVCKPPSNAPDWRSTLSRHLAKLPVHRRPKIVLVEKNDPLRTASGKPLRWKFTAHFAKFEESLIGSQLVWIDA